MSHKVFRLKNLKAKKATENQKMSNSLPQGMDSDHHTVSKDKSSHFEKGNKWKQGVAGDPTQATDAESEAWPKADAPSSVEEPKHHHLALKFEHVSPKKERDPPKSQGGGSKATPGEPLSKRIFLYIPLLLPLLGSLALLSLQQVTALSAPLNQAQHYKTPIIFASRVGADSSLIYDGSSGMASAKGQWQGAPAFQEGLVWVDTQKNGHAWTVLEDMHWLRKALVTGIRDNFHKQGVEGAIVGMSGGLDSAVVATLAREALGSSKVLGVALPSLVTSSESIRLAEQQCKKLGIELRMISITEPHASLEKAIRNQTGTPLAPRTHENLQSRIRGQILMALTTEPAVHKLLGTEKIAVINTANKSEAAVGYCTLYGDTVGILSPLGDCLKSRVFDLAQAMPDEVLAEIIARPPSAELSLNQTDEEALMPYRELDLILSMHLESNIPFHLIEENLNGSQLGFPQMSEKIKRTQMLLRHSEFKRKQMPFNLKVSPKAFGSGRQIPLTS